MTRLRAPVLKVPDGGPSSNNVSLFCSFTILVFNPLVLLIWRLDRVSHVSPARLSLISRFASRTAPTPPHKP